MSVKFVPATSEKFLRVSYCVLAKGFAEQKQVGQQGADVD